MLDNKTIIEEMKKLIEQNSQDNIEYKVDGIQYIGTREDQEDTILTLTQTDQILTCLADGIGGLEFGEIASALSCQTILKSYLTAGKIDSDFLLNAFNQADRNVQSFTKKENLKGSGCTLITVCIIKNEMFYCSIGDSSLFLYRDRKLKRINRQHNYKLYLDDLLFNQKISNFDYQNNLNKKDVVISYIGKGDISLIDYNKEAFLLKPGDVIIMCSDGVFNALDENILLEVVNKNQNPATINTSVMNLIKIKRNIKQDNSSIVSIYKGGNKE